MASAHSGSQPDGHKLSRAAAERLSLYLRCVSTRARAGSKISSEELSSEVGVSAAQVRRDLGSIGHLGQRGIGYDADHLALAIRETLGLTRTWNAVLIGVGNLARALLRYRGFSEQGFEVVALFDREESKIGQVVEGLTVLPLHLATTVIPRLKAELAILTVPQDAAQSVADLLVSTGIRGIMNFAPLSLRVPSSVQIITIDLAVQLEQLAFAVQVQGAEG